MIAGLGEFLWYGRMIENYGCSLNESAGSLN